MKKFGLIDILILVVPVVIMVLLIPVLPEQIPMQWNSSGGVNWYLPRELSFLLGLIPFAIYELIRLKTGKK